jgi:hypothetical protein
MCAGKLAGSVNGGTVLDKAYIFMPIAESCSKSGN